ncbi:MAG: cysteine desulfurase NifS [Clostridia bacterium]
MKRIYLDNAATTRVSDEVIAAMLPYLTTYYANPSSTHHEYGREARKGLDQARAQVAAALGADPAEIYFTGCGTEADNWAIRGTAYAKKDKGRHLITSAIEHHAVMHTCAALEREGFEVTYLPVDSYGRVSPDDLEKAIRPDTTLVSIMMANNEIGTLEPIAQLGAIAKAHGVWMHTDAVQAIGSVPIDLRTLPVDMLSLSGHKFHAPKGVGALYIRKGVHIARLIEGGSQERGQRAGTENMGSIVGMGVAIERATQNLEAHNAYLTALRDRLIAGIMQNIPEVLLNGHPTERLPGNANVSIRYVEGEALLMRLDLDAHIAASTGSACASGSLDPSHVLLAIGLPHEVAHGSLRFSFSEENTAEEVDETIAALTRIVKFLRALSPLYKG